jgi:hypothetical protein
LSSEVNSHPQNTRSALSFDVSDRFDKRQYSTADLTIVNFLCLTFYLALLRIVLFGFGTRGRGRRFVDIRTTEDKEALNA